MTALLALAEIEGWGISPDANGGLSLSRAQEHELRVWEDGRAENIQWKHTTIVKREAIAVSHEMFQGSD